MDQLGVAASATKFGIPAMTVAWNNGTARSVTVFTDVQKTPMNDLAVVNDTNGERMTSNRRNKRLQLRCSATPIGADAAAAQTIAADLPQQNDLVTITHATDTQIANTDNNTHTTIVDECSCRWTPDGHLVIDFTITKWFNKVFAALT